MAKTGYPTLITNTRKLAEQYHRLYADMVALTGLSGTGLTLMSAVNDALQAAAKDKVNLPDYRAQP